MTEADARLAYRKQIERWNHIAAETDRRTRVLASAYWAANIVAALPYALR